MFAIRFADDPAVNLVRAASEQAITTDHYNAAPIWLKSLLNDVGFGVLILDEQLKICFSNDDAKISLLSIGIDQDAFERKFTYKQSANSVTENMDKFLTNAKQASKGLRKLVIFGDHIEQTAVAMSPIQLDGQPFEFGVMVTMERKTVCEKNSLWAYGKVLGLTPGELKVLQQLANGEEPKLVAENLKISVTTVRSHIRSMVSKTESSCLRSLLMKIAKLPPIRTAINYL
jgi:Bacterial regulatory proteins, luxR family